MSSPYIAISSDELGDHAYNGRTGNSRLYASGEAHFFDESQSKEYFFYPPPGGGATDSNLSCESGLFDRSGLLSPFSNARDSRDYAITSFNTFNPYRHYINYGTTFTAGNDAAHQINISGLLTKSVYNFNIYNISFRTKEK